MYYSQFNIFSANQTCIIQMLDKSICFHTHKVFQVSSTLFTLVVNVLKYIEGPRKPFPKRHFLVQSQQ